MPQGSNGVAGGIEDAQAGADTLPDSELGIGRFTKKQKMDAGELQVLMKQLAKEAAEATAKQVGTAYVTGFANHKIEVKADIRT